MKVIACTATDEAGIAWNLVYDTGDVEAFETPIDVHDVTQPDDTAVRRQLGKAHLHLHFREGKRPTWEKAAELDESHELTVQVLIRQGDPTVAGMIRKMIRTGMVRLGGVS